MLLQYIPSYDRPALGRAHQGCCPLWSDLMPGVGKCRTYLFDTGVDGHFSQNTLAFGFVYMNYFDVVASRVG